MTEPRIIPFPRLVAFFAVALALFIFLAVFFHVVLIPFFIGLFFAYLLLPLVPRVQQLLRADRTWAALALLLSSLLAITLLLVLIVPVLRNQIFAIIKLFPLAKQYLFMNLIPMIKEFGLKFEVMSATELDQAIANLELPTQITSTLMRYTQSLLTSSGAFIGSFINLALVPVVCFFILKDYPNIARGIKNLIPPDLQEGFGRLAHHMNVNLKSVIKGQVMVAGILGVMYMAGLTIVGIKYSLAIGAIAGICRVVPYLDVIVGLTLSFMVIIIDPAHAGWGTAFGVLSVFAIVQALDGMLITPRVIGERVGLHPGVVIFSIFAFSSWFGFWGILIAIPVITILKVLLIELVQSYRNSYYFTGGGR